MLESTPGSGLTGPSSSPQRIVSTIGMMANSVNSATVLRRPSEVRDGDAPSADRERLKRRHDVAQRSERPDRRRSLGVGDERLHRCERAPSAHEFRDDDVLDVSAGLDRRRKTGQ